MDDRSSPTPKAGGYPAPNWIQPDSDWPTHSDSIVLEQQNLLLHVVLRVNELMLRTKQPGKLVRDICELLVDERGYRSAWIILFDSRGRISHHHAAGCGDAFQKLVETMHTGEFPLCVQAVRSRQQAFTISKPETICTGCPLATIHADRSARAVRLEYNRYLYGVLVVSIPNHIISDAEYSIFDAMAANIGYAFYSMQLEAAKERQMQEYLEAERQRAEAVTLAEKAARLASLGVMAGSITHEINQPLNAIKINADSLRYWFDQNQGALPDYFRQVVADISEGVDRIDQIVLYMRKFWRSSASGELERVDLHDTIRRVCFLTEAKLQAHQINLTLRLHDDTTEILARHIQMEQILINLIHNAIHALDRVKQESKLIKIRTECHKDRIVLQVLDNGPGIPENMLDDLFTPFHRQEDTGGGMGLGLTIVKMFLEQFHASITAENDPAGGARFTLTFPMPDDLEKELDS